MRAAGFAVAAIMIAALAQGAALAGEFRVSLDQTRTLPLTGPAAGVAIGNPSIAGVTMQNERLLFVTGRSYGTTNLIVVAEGGQTIFQGRITVVPDESEAVIVHRGSKATRYDCNPECRRRPDISDDPESFTSANAIIQARSGAAKN